MLQTGQLNNEKWVVMGALGVPPFYTSGKRVKNGTFIRGQKSFGYYRWSLGRGSGSEGRLFFIKEGRSAGYSWRIRMWKECALQKYHEAFAAKRKDKRGQYLC